MRANFKESLHFKSPVSRHTDNPTTGALGQPSTGQKPLLPLQHELQRWKTQAPARDPLPYPAEDYPAEPTRDPARAHTQGSPFRAQTQDRAVAGPSRAEQPSTAEHPSRAEQPNRAEQPSKLSVAEQLGRRAQALGQVRSEQPPTTARAPEQSEQAQDEEMMEVDQTEDRVGPETPPTYAGTE